MTPADAVAKKLHRAARPGAQLSVLDLFSGSGGMSLGFIRAGFRSVGGVEHDPEAATTFARNFHPHDLARHAVARDIRKTAPHDFCSQLKLGEPLLAVDVLIGGPPCPTFARIGRAKLREVAGRQDAHLTDTRSKLFLNYLHWVRELQPIAVVMENVPEFLNWCGRNIAEEVCTSLEGYRCAYTILNVAGYDVPQIRERFFLVGVREEAGSTFQFPRPPRKVKVPPGYISSRAVAMRHVMKSLGENVQGLHFVDAPEPFDDAPTATTVREALMGLPKIPIDEQFDRKLTPERRPYRPGNTSEYARQMRAGQQSVLNHATRCLTSRDHRIFERMLPGSEYPAAVAIAEQLFEEARRSRRPRPQEGSAEWVALRSAFVPPYDPSKFPNKWCKIDPESPSRTLMAHLGKDGYSHIHPFERRVISVREAARLQSFPDTFLFGKNLNPAYRQIGNAVPPLMAWHLARALQSALGVRWSDRKTIAAT